MYDRLLLPVDGSETAMRAAQRGRALARAFGATADVVHVVDARALRVARTPDERARLGERGERLLDSVAADSTVEYPVETHLLDGTPANRIVEHAVDTGADLVVMGNRGRTGLGARLLGSTTERVLQRGKLPVLVVPDRDPTGEPDTGYGRVLVPIDGSENARRALDHAIAIARKHGSTLHIVSIADLQSAGGPFDAGGLDREFIDRLESHGADAVEELRTAVNDEDPGLDVETAVVRRNAFGGVAVGIREYVAESEIDLLVMGSHGRSNLARQLLGSVTATVLRTVGRPVLVVPRRRSEAADSRTETASP